MANEFKVKVGVELNDKSFETLKNSINGKDAGDIKVNLNIEDAEKKIKSLKTQIKSLGNLKVNLNVGTGSGKGKGASSIQSTVSGVNDAYNDLKNLAKRINSIRIQIAGLDSSKNAKQINELEGQLNELMSTYNNLFNSLSKGLDIPKLTSVKKEINSVESELEELWRQFEFNDKNGFDTTNIIQNITKLEARLESLYNTYRTFGNGLTTGQIDSLTNSFEIASGKISVLDAKAEDLRASLKAAFTSNFNAGKYDQQLDSITRRFDKLKNSSVEAKAAMNQYTAAHTALCAAINKENADIDEIIAANKQYEKSLERVISQLKINENAQKALTADDSLKQSQQRLSNQIERWMLNNSAAMKQYGAQLQKLQVQLRNCDKTELNHIKSEFDEIRLAAEKAGLATQSMGDKIKSKMGEYAAYFSVASLAMEAVQALKYMAQTVLEVDTAMTGLYRVTELTTSQYDELFDNMIASAKEYGRTLTDTINATSDWVKAGFDDPNTALGLAEITAMYQNVSDLDYDTASENLLTAYNGFKDTLLEDYGGDALAAVEHITDVYNKIDNEFSVTSAGLGEGISRSASALQLAGNTFEEAVGMIGAVTEVTQDPEKAGSAMKVLSLRLRGMKGELQEMGEEVDDNVESISKMQTQILNMTDGKVNIFDENGDFRSTYDIMVDIAEVYDQLSDTDQADLLETIAGKNRANDVAALISNIENAVGMAETGLDAAGSAAEENAKYVDSLQGRLNALTASWQAFSTTVLESDFLKGLVSFANELLDAITFVIDKFGTLPTLIGSIGAISTILGGGKSGGLFTNLVNQQGYNALRGVIGNLQIMKVSVADLMAAFNSGSKAGGLNGFLGGLSSISNVVKDTITKKDISNIQQYNSLIGQGVNPMTAWYQTMQTSSKAAKELVTQANGCQVATKNLTTATSASKVAMIGAKAATVGLQLATIALNAAVTMGIGALISWATSAISKAINYADELADKVDEATASYKEQHDELVKNQSNFDSLAESYAKLSKGVYKFTGANKSLTTDEYEEYQNVVNQIADMVPSLVSGYDEQGNAILNCASGVDVLTQAYKDMIIAENEALLNGDGEDYEGISDISKDLSMDYENMIDSGLWGDQLTIFGAGQLEKILNSSEIDEDVVAQYAGNTMNQIGNSLKDALTEKGIELEGVEIPNTFSSRETWNTFIAEACKQHPEVAREIVNSMDAEMDTATEGMRNAISAHMETAFLNKDYSNISDEMQVIAESIVGGLDSELIIRLNESGGEDAVLDYVDGILSALDGLSTENADKVLNGFDLASQFQSGDISYGDYKKQLEETMGVIEDMGLDKEVVSQIRLSLNVDEINEEYDALKTYLTDEEFGIKMSTEDAEGLLKDLTATELTVLCDLKASGKIDTSGMSTEELRAYIEEEAAIQEALDFTIDISAETEGIDNLNAAMKESVSAAGLTADSLEAVKSRYEALDSYDPSALFEKSAQGIHLNREELNRLEDELNNSTLDNIDDSLKTVIQAYEDTTEEIRTCSDETERQALIAEQLTYANKINELSELQSQYEGLTSAYNKWIDAQESGEEGDIYDSAMEGLESAAELKEKGLVGTNEFAAAVEFMSGKDTSAMTVDEIVAAYDEALPKMKRYFTEGSEGVENMLKDLNAMNEEWAHINENGEWELDIPIDEAAEKLGVSVDALEAVLGKGSDYGLEINYDSVYEAAESLEELYTEAETANDRLRELGKTDLTFSFESTNAEDLTNQIEKAQKMVNEFKEEDLADDGKINLSVEGAEEAQLVLETLMLQKQEVTKPAFMNVSVATIGDENLGKVIQSMQEIQTYQNLYEIQVAIGADTSETETKIGEVIGEINTLKEQNPQVFADLGLNTDEFNTALSTLQDNITVGATLDSNALATVQTALSGVDATVLANVGIGDTTAVDTYASQTQTANGTVNWDNNTTAVDTWISQPHTADGLVYWDDDTTNLETTYTGTGYIIWNAAPKVDGTAHVDGSAFAGGTAGRAFKQGDWGIKGSGTALVGELGQELLVRDGHFYTIGDESAEFIKYKQGDIIFNAAQTKEIFEKGKITHGSGRGRVFSSGSAFASGTVHAQGRAFADNKATGGGTLYGSSSGSSGSSSKSSSKSSSSSSSSASDEAEEFLEKIDWIEVAIDRIERAISRLDLTASSVFKKWGTRNSALVDQIGKVREEIDLQERAYNRYMQEANSVGLSSSYAAKVRNGEINIEEITDEDLKEKIDEYQEWYFRCHPIQ